MADGWWLMASKKIALSPVRRRGRQASGRRRNLAQLHRVDEVARLGPRTLVALSVESGDPPEVGSRLDVREIHALDLSGGAIDPGLVDELLELGVSGDLDVIAGGIGNRGPSEVVHREVALEDLTVLGSEELRGSLGKRVGRLGLSALGGHERTEVAVDGNLQALVTEVNPAFEHFETSGALGLDLHAELGSTDEGRRGGRRDLETAVALGELLDPRENGPLVELQAGGADFTASGLRCAV